MKKARRKIFAVLKAKIALEALRDDAQARETLRLMLARRRGAPQRAGVAYRLVGLEGWDVSALLG